MKQQAVVFKRRKQLLLRVPTFSTEYRFRLVGTNGEPIAQSEGYTAKQSATDVIKKYFPDFQLVDDTGE